MRFLANQIKTVRSHKTQLNSTAKDYTIEFYDPWQLNSISLTDRSNVLTRPIAEAGEGDDASFREASVSFRTKGFTEIRKGTWLYTTQLHES
mmetsp:Transcript_18870/g.41784  ORF Transcript_18870/g.41784 Transcript_18870/m.41784 type:complete len:92 (-) Transcript_18870:324-599(-)